MSETNKALTAVKSVSLKSGNDARVAAELKKGFQASQKAGRVIMAFGLFAWEVKTVRLKHGQWFNWLFEHCPELCRKDKATGQLIPKPLSAVHTYMGMTKDVLEDMGFTIEKWFKHLANTHGVGFCHDGKFLLAPPKKLTKEAAELKQQICDRVDGKTVKQIRLGFSQVEEDEETGELKTKRGRRKGEGGASAEQRAAAKEREERERIEDCEAMCLEIAATILQQCDDQHAGLISDAAFKQFSEALETGHHYCKRVQQMRKGK